MKTQTANMSRFQFRLRSLMIAMAGLSVLFAGLSLVRTPIALTFCWFLCLIVFHFAAAVLGHRSQREFVPVEKGRRNDPPGARPLEQRDSVLRGNKRIGPGIMVVTVCGGLLGASIGGAAISTFGRVAPAGMLVGTASSAVIGTFVGFLAASFIFTSFTAVQQAARRS